MGTPIEKKTTECGRYVATMYVGNRTYWVHILELYYGKKIDRGSTNPVAIGGKMTAAGAKKRAWGHAYMYCAEHRIPDTWGRVMIVEN
jgi:hypothetical protein